jgi:predicted nucleic acid-binding protein
MIFLETSFLIAFYVKKDKHHENSMRIWKAIKNEEKIINKMTLYEFLTVLRKKNIKDIDVKRYYNEIINNLIILEDLELHQKALEICLNNPLGFFDNLHRLSMLENEIMRIASFDTGYDIFEDIERIS